MTKDISIDDKLDAIHKKYSFISEDEWNQEMAEQRLSVEYLQGNEVCLEIGACIGRNTIVISECLNKNGFVYSIESNPRIFNRLEKSIRDSKRVNIIISNKPISSKRMMVNGWSSITLDPEGKVLDGWTEVQTQTLNQVKQQCRISNFNTLLLNCEGAFYHIIKDYKDIMDGVTKVFIENDFSVKEHADYVHNVFSFLGFKVAKSVPLKGGPDFPCKDYFWQVWIKE